MRRTLIIIGAVVVIVGVGIAIYFLFFVTTPPTTLPGVGFPNAGNNPPGGGGTGGTGGSTTPAGPTAVTPRLIKISAGPVVPGVLALDTKAASSTTAVVSYIERLSGNVFSYAASTRTITRLSNKTIPGIQSASWFPDGSKALVRYLSGGDFSTVNSYVLAATSTDGFFLAQDLADAAAGSAGILSLASGVNGSIASLSRADGTKPAQIFTSPLTSLRVGFAGKGQYLAFTKPAAGLEGNAYLTDAAGHFTRVGATRNGLVALASPSGAWVLISSAHGSTVQMELVDTATNEIIPLPVSTIADKCVWSADETSIYCGIPLNLPVASYPDDWYQGALHFSDRIWRIQVAGRYAQLVLDFPKEAKAALDATSLSLDPAGTMLIFVNKNDGSLWGYSL